MCLDLILARKDNAPTNTYIDQTGSISLDHSPVVATFTLNTKQEEWVDTLSTTRIFNSVLLHSKEKKEKVQEEIKELLMVNPPNEHATPAQTIEHVSNIITKWCQENLVRKAPRCLLYKRNHALGEKLCFIKKVVKTQRYIAHRLVCNKPVHTTKTMRGIASGPECIRTVFNPRDEDPAQVHDLPPNAQPN